MIQNPHQHFLNHLLSMRLSNTNRVIAFFGSKVDNNSSYFLLNKSNSSSKSSSSPKCFLLIPSKPDLMVDESSLGCGFGWGIISTISMLKHPFRFTAASNCCIDGKNVGKLKVSTFSSLVTPYFKINEHNKTLKNYEFNCCQIAYSLILTQLFDYAKGFLTCFEKGY